MSTDIDKTNKKSLFSVSSLVVRSLIYSGFMAGILASFYNFKLNTIKISSSARWPQVKQDITSINEAQQAYYAKNNKFSDSLDGLGIKVNSTNNYKYKIMSSSMNPVQILENKREPAQVESASVVIAIPIGEEWEGTRYGAVYRGAVFAFKKDVGNQLTTISVICESEPLIEGYPSYPIQPTFDGTKTDCPPYTNILR
ncbi:type IV pilin-like G/H family protein [Microcoleus sp. LEGE 07076]|nr:type IV pilin-like G/H family protein [Microcoleus sp. LEGE 07076]MBE9185910.1 type IV pilin-like G/H family protein [Microcoleus sp. LEGE 07076]